VLLVAATYPPTRCGVADYTHRLALALAANGASVHVLTGASQDPEHQHDFPALEPVVGAPPADVPMTLPVSRPDADGIRVMRAVERWDWSSRAAFAAALRSAAPAVVSLQYHGEDFWLHPAVCTFAEMAHAVDIGTVTTFHNLQKPRGWAHGIEPLDLLLYESAAWITTNQIDRAEMQPLEDAAHKLHLVPTGPSFDRAGVGRPVAAGASGEATQAPAESARDGGLLHLAYFGFLNPAKGIEQALRAVAQLRDAGLPVRFTLAAGLHTDATSRLRDYAHFIHDEIRRLQLTEIVEVVGFLPEPELDCDLGVFPFRDGVCDKNTSFWTALEHATPCLTTTGAGLPEGLEHAKHVLLATCAPEGLATQMRWAHAQRDALAALGRAGQEYVRRRLDWNHLAGQMLRIFDGTSHATRGAARAALRPSRTGDA
jgi:glycosyltransferase involved in cell wall biosynthesis